MDEIEKLLRKVKRKDRERLLEALDSLQRGQIEHLSIKRLAGSRFFRVRIGNFRILFSLDTQKNTLVIESIRLRNEGTYR